MSAGLVGLAIAVVAGGILAVAARESRIAVGGLALVTVLAPLLSDPPPAPLPLAARVLGGALVAWLLLVVVRAARTTDGSAIGWLGDALAAAGAGVAGWTAAAAGPAGLGPAAPPILGAGLALGVLAITPVLAPRDALRFAAGLVLTVEAAVLVRVALAGPPTAVEQLAVTALVAVVGGAGAGLAAAAIRGGGDLALARLVRAGAHRSAGGDGGTGQPIAPRSAGARRVPGG